MLYTKLLYFLSVVPLAISQQDTSCSVVRPCLVGCCSKFGQCGFGDAYCGDGCQGTCDAKPECGKGADKETCPLGVCCSQYGFCGTTSGFCGGGCQNGCTPVKRPSCNENTDARAYKRRIGYYEMFNLDRQCNRFLPEHIPAGALTHINLAFAEIGSDFKIIDDPKNSDAIARVAHLKDTHPGLKVNIAIGGWDFNDPPTQRRFSDMVSKSENQATFILSLLQFMRKYSLDGVDIDWEYPAALDRGGIEKDELNFVILLGALRGVFDEHYSGGEISITLPSSYWYLRGFRLKEMQEYVHYFNLMSYDLHGMWDQHNKFTGPYLKGHTNFTEIEDGLDLLWRNGIDPKNVVMGFGFYGRSFTMADPTCSDPAKGCKFSAAGLPGDCSATAGILTYAEIRSRNKTLDAETFYDTESTVKYTTYQYNQWISYDDAQSFFDKKRRLSSRCLSGLMIWAIDQDTDNYDALTGLLGEKAIKDSLFRSGQLTDEQKQRRSEQFAPFTGQNCFVTEECTDGSSGQQGIKQVCPAGTASVETAHSPLQHPGRPVSDTCDKGWYRHICCPIKEMPKNCKWNGAGDKNDVNCYGKCGPNQFKLNLDRFKDRDGNDRCLIYSRSLCCDSTDLLHDCTWTECQGPLLESQKIGEAGTTGCPLDTKLVAMRYDKDDGNWCSRDVAKSDLHSRFKRGLCCPKKHYFNNCAWDNDNFANVPKGDIGNGEAPQIHPCLPGRCFRTQTKIAQSWEPAPIPDSLDRGSQPGRLTIEDTCPYLGLDYDHNFSLCCDPPAEYNDRWPVPPHYLWENSFEDDDADVAWTFSDDFGNNNADKKFDDPYEKPGDDPYGFIMLDGGPDSLSGTFDDDFTVVRHQPQVLPIQKRSWITSNKTILDSTFEHKEETVYVYCNHASGSAVCERPFVGGAPDTIISLPSHVGDGPYARIVSMEEVSSDYSLPAHHIRSRSKQENTNPIYKLTFDYNFHAIREDKGPVNMRVDYTNLMSYWHDITGAEPSKKRAAQSAPLTNEEWKSRVKRASEAHSLQKRDLVKRSGSVQMTQAGDHQGLHLHKRWFGKFLAWLKRLTSVEKAERGVLPMTFAKSLLLYKASKGCPYQGLYAKLAMYLDSSIEMDATYAYYFSGTLIPPKIEDTYAYLGVEPTAYLGLRVEGQAQMVYTSERKKLIDTLAYPGLSIRGIATIGPSLDMYGQIRGSIKINGQVTAGATAKFGKTEVYFPHNNDGKAMEKLHDVNHENSKPQKFELEPQFFASAKAEATLDIIVSPEVHLGLAIAPSVGAKELVTLVDAQLIAFVNGTLRFKATVVGQAGTATKPSYTYSYGAYLIFNLGYGGYANIASGTWNWRSEPVYAYSYPGLSYPIYENDKIQSDPTNGGGGLKRSNSMSVSSRHWKHIELDSSSKAILESAVASSDLSLPSKSHTNESFSLSLLDDSVFLKRDGSDNSPVDQQDPKIDKPGQKLECNSNGQKEITLPDFRYSCLAFSSNRVTFQDGTKISVPGICDGIQDFFQHRALSNNGLTLTYEPIHRDARDRVVCGESFCKLDDKFITDGTGFPRPKSGWVSCDEFPFGSAEEGGEFFRSIATTNTEPGHTCVPVWQQTLQGSCNGIFRNLRTNIAYFDRNDTANGGGDTPQDWRSWEQNGWITQHGVDRRPGAEPIPAFERLALYPDIIPLSPGVKSTDWENSNMRLGRNFKRNYTFGLAYTHEVSNTEWGSQPFEGYRLKPKPVPPVQQSSKDGTLVACAVNTFGQKDIYRWRKNSYNGFCYFGSRSPNDAFGIPPSYRNCQVDFEGSDFLSNSEGAVNVAERDVNDEEKPALGYFNGQKITGIRILEDRPESVVIDDGWTPPADQLIPLPKKRRD